MEEIPWGGGDGVTFGDEAFGVRDLWAFFEKNPIKV
jgi:hypothetical protein